MSTTNHAPQLLVFNPSEVGQMQQHYKGINDSSDQNRSENQFIFKD